MSMYKLLTLASCTFIMNFQVHAGQALPNASEGEEASKYSDQSLEDDKDMHDLMRDMAGKSPALQERQKRELKREHKFDPQLADRQKRQLQRQDATAINTNDLHKQIKCPQTLTVTQVQELLETDPLKPDTKKKMRGYSIRRIEPVSTPELVEHMKTEVKTHQEDWPLTNSTFEGGIGGNEWSCSYQNNHVPGYNSIKTRVVLDQK